MVKHNRGATPLYAAALKGADVCAALLLKCGANPNAMTENEATPMLVACQEGHLLTSMLLSSYGASRETRPWRGLVPLVGTWADELAYRYGHEELVRWLRASGSFSPLHHIQVLTPQHTLALLHEGCSPTACCTSPCYKSPVSPADLACKHPSNAAAEIILNAAKPWSPATHELWSDDLRARAVFVLKLGYLLAHEYAAGAECSMRDVWLAHVMPLAVTWDDSCTPVFAYAASIGKKGLHCARKKN